MQSFGINTSSTNSEEEDSADDSAEDEILPQQPQITQDLQDLLRMSDFNWFQFMENLPDHQHESVQPQLTLESFSNCGFTEQENVSPETALPGVFHC